jgi:tyrosinase
MRRLVVFLLAFAALAGLAATSSPAATTALRVRKDVKNLTAQEKADFVAAVKKLRTVPSPWDPSLSYYDQFVWWHREAFDCDINAAHMSSAFLPWHREFLLLFENALRKVSGKPITVPYWNWGDPASTAAVFKSDFMGGDGNSNQGYAVTSGPFRKGVWNLDIVDPPSNDPYGFHHLVRRFGTALAPTLPTGKEILYGFGIPAYDKPPYDATTDPSTSFRQYIEGWRGVTGMKCEDGLMNPVSIKGAPHAMHNGVHLWVGGVWPNGQGNPPIQGTMALNTSLNDPVFWLHHSNIDRLWAQWESIYGEQYQPVSGAAFGQNLFDTMWPYRTVGIKRRIADTLDIHSLGYTYASP